MNAPEFAAHRENILSCKLCKGMVGPPVSGAVQKSRIISVGQAPGPHEARIGKPFAYTAGRTLFKWFKSIGIEEERFRSRVNMSAVCRCFPGKSKKQSGDRIPTGEEIQNCSAFMKFEFQKHRPALVIPIGKLAIQEIMGRKKLALAEIIGTQSKCTLYGIDFDCIPLPHPSGLNAWNNMEPGKTLIRKALQRIKRHPAVKAELLGPS